MNERFAAEPEALRGWQPLQILLQNFGPLNGRYLAAYPKDWRAKVEALNGTLGELDISRVKSLLQRAAREWQIISDSSLPYDPELTWLGNGLALVNTTPRRLHGLVIDGTSSKPAHVAVFALHELALPPTGEEAITTTPSEFVRVSRTLLVASPELYFVDPFLNPCNQYVRNVLAAMFEVAVKARCESIVCWAKASILREKGTSQQRHTIEDVRRALDAIVPATKKSLKVALNLVEDWPDNELRMHPRYLLSLHGGIRFDHGFQTLPRGSKTDVVPITTRPRLDQLISTYHVRNSPLKVMHHVRVSRG